MAVENFVVVSFNCWNSFEGSISAGLDFLAYIHKQQQNDVFVLSEMFRTDFFKHLKKHQELLAHFPYHTPQVGQTNKVRKQSTKKTANDEKWDSTSGRLKCCAVHNGGVSILSKYPIESQHQHVYYAGKGTQGCFENKGCVLAQICKGTKKFNIVGTHTQADLNVRQDNTAVRVKQMKEMRDWLGVGGSRTSPTKTKEDSSGSNPVPQIVKNGDFLMIAGDLNMPYDGPKFHRALDEVVGFLGMQHFIRSKVVDQAKTDKRLGPPLSATEYPISYSVSNNEIASYGAGVPMNGKNGKTRKQLADQVVKEGKARNDLLDYIFVQKDLTDAWVETPQQLLTYDLFTKQENCKIGIISNRKEQNDAEDFYQRAHAHDDRHQFIGFHPSCCSCRTVYTRDVSDHYPAILTLMYKT